MRRDSLQDPFMAKSCGIRAISERIRSRDSQPFIVNSNILRPGLKHHLMQDPDESGLRLILPCIKAASQKPCRMVHQLSHPWGRVVYGWRLL
jgi:hypothetical protein